MLVLFHGFGIKQNNYTFLDEKNDLLINKRFQCKTYCIVCPNAIKKSLGENNARNSVMKKKKRKL